MPTLQKLLTGWALCGFLLAGLACNKQPTDKGQTFGNSAPDTFFAPVPLDGSINNAFKLRLEWHGNDGDGIIKGYEYRLEGPLQSNAWIHTESFYADLKLRDGWYNAEVRAIDNSGNVDPTPAKRRFHVLGPTFDKGILLIDDEPSAPNVETLVDAIYDSLLREAGYDNFTVWDYQTQYATSRPLFAAAASDTDATGARKTGLGSFSTIIWCTTPTGNLGLNRNTLQDYLDMGGNLCIAGSNPLESLTGESPSGADMPTSGIPFKYFRILRAKTADIYIDQIVSTDPQLPDIHTSYQVPRTPIYQYLKVPTNQIVPLYDARPLYAFSRNHYRDTARSIDVNSEEYAGLSCAIYYQGTDFNTAIFGFPLVSVVTAGRVLVNLVDKPATTQALHFVLANVFEEPQ